MTILVMVSIVVVCGCNLKHSITQSYAFLWKANGPCSFHINNFFALNAQSTAYGHTYPILFSEESCVSNRRSLHTLLEYKYMLLQCEKMHLPVTSFTCFHFISTPVNNSEIRAV